MVFLDFVALKIESQRGLLTGILLAGCALFAVPSLKWRYSVHWVFQRCSNMAVKLRLSTDDSPTTAARYLARVHGIAILGVHFSPSAPDRLARNRSQLRL